MTLDEAIKHCEEVAKNQKEDFKACPLSSSECDGLTHCKVLKHGLNKGCLKCASEHRQLADWLKELKAYRKAEKEIEQELVNWNDIDNGKCRGLFLATSIIQHYKDEEVNADD